MKNVATFKNFSKYQEIISAISTCRCGDLNIRQPFKNLNAETFLSSLGITRNQLIMGEQIHDSQVAIVTKKDGGKVISGTDGLVTTKTNLFLGINVADCPPILFYDPEYGVCAVCHAGWKGTLKRIAQKTIEIMEKAGSSAKNIIVGIGPHIKVCCYDISPRRAKLFQDAFGKDEKMLRSNGCKVYLDLTYLNLKQLRQAGIREENIEVSPYCTFHDNDKFFSARRQKKEDFAENLAIIGRKN